MLKAYWYKRSDVTDLVANVGDILTPIILKHILNEDVVWSARGYRILACGSIVELVHNGDIVWGSGLIRPMRVKPRKNVKIVAVRGKLTRKNLIESGYDCPEVYGDPGMLMPDVYNPEIEKIHEIGFVPHYVEKKEFQEWFGGHQINIINNPFIFIDQMLECEAIITSSLHAFILARAYGLKAEYTQLTDKIHGGLFKYHDFLSGQKDYDEKLFIKALKDGVKKQ
jgi:pyruvyltransferase